MVEKASFEMEQTIKTEATEKQKPVKKTAARKGRNDNSKA